MKILLKLLAVGIATTSTALWRFATGVLPDKPLYFPQTNRPTAVHHSTQVKTTAKTLSPAQTGEVLGITSSRATQRQQGTAPNQFITLSQLNQRFDDYTK